MSASSLPVDRPHNLPAHLPSLIGRDAALVLLRQVMLAEGRALLTLTGAGGTSKTRLALALAASLLDAVDFRMGCGWSTSLHSATAGPSLKSLLPAWACTRNRGCLCGTRS